MRRVRDPRAKILRKVRYVRAPGARILRELLRLRAPRAAIPRGSYRNHFLYIKKSRGIFLRLTGILQESQTRLQ